MNDPRTFVIGCVVILIVLLALIIVGAVLLIPSIPEVSEQLPPGSSTLQVNLTTPLHGSKLLLDTPAAVYAEAVGAKPVVALELWVDGVSFGSHSPASGATTTWFSAAWAWAPTSAGDHLLFARAMDENGQVVTSNVARVIALPIEEYPLPVSKETPDEMESIPVSEPAPEEYEGPPPGATESSEPPPAMIPPNDPSPDAPPPPAVPSGSTQPAPSIPPDKMAIWIRHILGGMTALPEAPSLAADVEGCSVRLFVTDHTSDEDGFFIYRLGPGDTAFQRIATLDDYQESDPFVYMDADQYGKFLYYVASFNAAGESPSPATQPLVIDAPQCIQPQHTGLGLADGKITTSTPVDKLYCYVSFNKGPWARIPPGTNTFIYPQNGEFDIGEYVELLTTPPPQTDVTLDLECWGWQGDLLVELGRVSQTFGPSQFNSPIQMVGINYSLIGQLSATQLMGGSGSIPDPHIAPPMNVRLSTDPAVCASGDLGDVFSGIFCQGMVDAGDAILTWSWWPTIGCWPASPGQPSQCPYNVEDIDGYRIYVHYPGQAPSHIDTVANPKQTMRGTPPLGEGSVLARAFQSALGTTPPCYTVRAYKGKPEESEVVWESEDSLDCVQAIRTEGRMSIYQSQLNQWSGLRSVENCPVVADTDDIYYWEHERSERIPHVRIGFDHSHRSIGLGCVEKLAYFHRAIVYFDLTRVAGPVTGATLKADTFYGSGSALAGGNLTATNCGMFLMANGADFVGPGVWPLAGIDVTTPVREAQARGATGITLVLRGWDESFNIDQNKCYRDYGDFKLDVTYIP